MTKNKKYKLLEDYILNNKESHYRTAYSYVKNKEDALDVVQESIYKALSSIEAIEHIEFLKTWFYRILINTSIDYLRKSRKVTYVDDMILDIHSDRKEDTYQDFDLQDALDKLPDEYKSIITLRYFEDLKLEEIAEILQQNLNTVKTRLYAGLKKLRIEIEV